MKLRTDRMKKPAPSVTVLLVERMADGWHPVVERHVNCRGMTHETCTVAQRFVGADPLTGRGFATQAAATEAIGNLWIEHRPKGAGQ